MTASQEAALFASLPSDPRAHAWSSKASPGHTPRIATQTAAASSSPGHHTSRPWSGDEQGRVMSQASRRSSCPAEQVVDALPGHAGVEHQRRHGDPSGTSLRKQGRDPVGRLPGGGESGSPLLACFGEEVGDTAHPAAAHPAASSARKASCRAWRSASARKNARRSASAWAWVIPVAMRASRRVRVAWRNQEVAKVSVAVVASMSPNLSRGRQCVKRQTPERLTR